MIPALALIDAAGATARLDPDLGLLPRVDAAMQFILTYDFSVANQSAPGWFGPWINEPGDVGGFGLWRGCIS
jgi:hypothetical protein